MTTNMKNGPAGAPTPPSHGSTHPSKGQMNMKMNSATPSGEQDKRHYCEGSDGKGYFDKERFRADLAKLTASDLEALFDLLRASDEAMLGIYNQPRFSDAALNVAGFVIDEVSSASVVVLNEALSRKLTADNCKAVAAVHLKYEMLCFENSIDIAKVALRYADVRAS